MRSFLVVSLMLAGCATTGTGPGLSSEMESNLRSLGPEINREFSLAGSSLDIESGRELSILVRDDSFSSLVDSEQALRSRSVAEWVWGHGGEEAGVAAITVAITGEGPSTTETKKYRFVASELEEAKAEEIAR